MKTTTVASMKSHLSALLRRAQAGETIVVLNRGKAIARLGPATPTVRGRDAERISRLEQAGVLTQPEVVSDWRSILKPSPVADPQGAVLAALLEERREGR